MKKTILTIIASIFFTVGMAFAQLPADLDETFGINTVLEENGYDSIADIETNSRNVIFYATQYGIKVFKSDGKTLVNEIPNIPYLNQNNLVKINNIEVLDDNSILVAGFFYSNGSRATGIVKLKSNLQIDTSFGQNGFAIIDNAIFSYSSGDGDSLVVQPDNKILIIGSRYDKTTPNHPTEHFL